MRKSKPSAVSSHYTLQPDGHFVIRDYNHTKPFSNFFPGIAGPWGIPMWVFYVNRGQGISSFGIESKDKAILEFQAANKAYRLTSLQGFRTFLKITAGGKTIFYEPFQDSSSLKPFKTTQTMSITGHDLTIEDINHTLGIKVKVNYFTIPQEPFAALVRQVTVSNLSSKKYDIQMVDGLPAIVPFGLNDGLLKNMPRTAEAWVQVDYLKNRTPFYRLKVVISDKPEVTHIHEGNFYFSFESGKSGKAQLLEPIADPACVFGECWDFGIPETFVNAKNFKLPVRQQTSNKTLSAMSFVKFSLKGKGEKVLISAFGYAAHDSQMKGIVSKVTAKDFVVKKWNINREIIEGIGNFALTASSSPAFDRYARQTFVDNVLRGGLPISFKAPDGDITFHIYSRKHGDPERDYNYFVLSPTYLSQGNGNYRDVNQNRRNDVWFNKGIGQDNVVNFLNLVQADGYNPLIIKGTTFSVDEPERIETIIKDCIAEPSDKIKKILHDGFQPGQLLKAIHQHNIRLKVSPVKFLSEVMSCCRKHEVADHGEGFWTDHWTYNLDLIESYLSVYPDQLSELLLGRHDFHFYFNSHYVLPREERYILTPRGVRQYESVKNAPKETHAHAKGHKLHTRHGQGEIYHTHLIAKLLCLIANKVATLDPSGTGVEMEADKPNWYDALNGLPGLLGSSISETFEVKRLALFVRDAFLGLSLNNEQQIKIFTELAQFIRELTAILSSESDALSYWQRSNDAKEQYRASIRLGIDGKEEDVSIGEIGKFLDLVIEKTDHAAESAKMKGLYATYFYHEVVEYERLDKIDKNGCVHVRPKVFKRHDLPLFLEGFVHALRVEHNVDKARELYRDLKKSALFDRKLKMYKVNAGLASESEEIGRCRIFPSGWLENESIWLHMEYKLILEVLRCGLFAEFYEDFCSALIPFQKPEQYGRSILENSSFIVSSAHADPELHGQGFVARLSGSTAEFLHIWLLMNAGLQPFAYLGGQLTLRFQPALPGWLFTEKETVVEYSDREERRQKIAIPKNAYAFNFMGSTLVVYHNAKRRNTYGPHKVVPQEMHLRYFDRRDVVTLKSAVISAPYAEDVRAGLVKQIDIVLG